MGWFSTAYEGAKNVYSQAKQECVRVSSTLKEVAAAALETTRNKIVYGVSTVAAISIAVFSPVVAAVCLGTVASVGFVNGHELLVAKQRQEELKRLNEEQLARELAQRLLNEARLREVEAMKKADETAAAMAKENTRRSENERLANEAKNAAEHDKIEAERQFQREKERHERDKRRHAEERQQWEQEQAQSGHGAQRGYQEHPVHHQAEPPARRRRPMSANDPGVDFNDPGVDFNDPGVDSNAAPEVPVNEPSLATSSAPSVITASILFCLLWDTRQLQNQAPQHFFVAGIDGDWSARHEFKRTVLHTGTVLYQLTMNIPVGEHEFKYRTEQERAQWLPQARNKKLVVENHPNQTNEQARFGFFSFVGPSPLKMQLKHNQGNWSGTIDLEAEAADYFGTGMQLHSAKAPVPLEFQQCKFYRPAVNNYKDASGSIKNPTLRKLPEEWLPLGFSETNIRL